MLESVIQRKIIIELEKYGWFVLKLIQTNKNGIPDLLALRNGTSVFIEVKAEKNKPSALQQYRIGELKTQSFETIIAYNIKDVEKLCK